MRISSQGFGLWLEGREALLLGLVFDFSTPGFLPATQDVFHGGLFGIGYFLVFFKMFVIGCTNRRCWNLGLWDWLGTHAYGAAAGIHILTLRGWGNKWEFPDGVLGELVYLRTLFGVNIIRWRYAYFLSCTYRSIYILWYQPKPAITPQTQDCGPTKGFPARAGLRL